MRALVLYETPDAKHRSASILQGNGFSVEAQHLLISQAPGGHAGNYDLVLIAGAADRLHSHRSVEKVRHNHPSAAILVSGETFTPKAVASLLRAGADDVVSDRASHAELVQRLHSIVRRYWGAPASNLTMGPITLDLFNRMALMNGQYIHLTAAEYRVLRKLLVHQGKFLSQEQLSADVAAKGGPISSNALSVLIHKLRNKLQFGAGGLIAIEQHHLFGYRMAQLAPVREAA